MVFVAFGGMQILDLAGPLQALTTANDEGADPVYAPRTVSSAAGPVRTASGLDILAEASGGEYSVDTLFLPGGPGVFPARRDPAMMELVRRLAAKAERVCAVCTGAFLAGEAGLLDGRRATTHWRSAELLAREYPAVRVDPGPIFIRENRIWTSAGVTAGIDLTLALIEDDHGQALAAQVARRLVVYLRRPGGQAQFSLPLSLQARSASPYGELLQAVADSPGEDWSVERLAERVFQSVRTFHRAFRETTGRTPARAVEDIRFERARILLETTDLTAGQIAVRCGLGGEEQMRRAFKRRLGLSPTEMRRRFGGGGGTAASFSPAPTTSGSSRA